MTMTRTHTVVFASVLFAGAVAAVLVLRDGSGSAVAAVAAPPAAEVVAPGTVEAVSERTDLSFEQAGRVTEVLVDEGQKVEKGQVLMRLDDRLPRARVARAE